jgi:hypothetical protein
MEMIVTQLRRVVRTANLEFALRIGAIITHHFFHGDIDRWRARGLKNISFRRLAQHPRLPMSAGALCRCVAMFELCERLNVPSRWEHLGVSHIRLVLGLAPTTQERLLSLANHEKWTVRALSQAVLRERAGHASRGGRRPEQPIARSLTSVRKCLEAHRDLLGQIKEPSPEDIRRSRALLGEIQCCLEEVSQLLVQRPQHA